MYKLTNHIIDILTGFDIRAKLDEILQLDNWSREQIENYQKKKFSELAEIAKKTLYYKNLKSDTYENFPIVTKDILSKNFLEFKTNIRKPYKKISTSGSTGQPFTFYLSKEMLLLKRVSHQKMLTWFGLNREAREMKIGGQAPDLKNKIYHIFKNKRHIGSIDLDDAKLLDLVHHYNRFKPEVLYGYPTAIAGFSMFAAKNKYSLHQPKIIVTHAENLYEHLKLQINETFPKIPVINQYWATEANIGVMCPEGNIHVDEDTVICETINHDEEGFGDLLITNLYSFDFPLIKYKIGDRVKLNNKECSCGRKTKIIEAINGRAVNYCQLNNGKRIYYTGTSSALAKYCQNIMQYQLIYNAGTNKLFFNYIPLDNNYSIDKNSINHYFKQNFDIEIDFAEVKFIPFEKSGKFEVYKTIS